MAATAIGVFGFGGLAIAQAGGAVQFDFENKPLFSETNFLPGGSVARWVAVSNGTDTAHEIGVKFYDVSDDNIGLLEKFSSKFSFDVKKNGVSVLSGGAMSLKTLFGGNPLTLETLASGASVTYHFEIAFDASAGNDYQGKSLGFSLCVLVDGECGGKGSDEPNPAPQTLLTRASGGGIGGDRAVVPLKYFDYEVKGYCLNDGTVMAMFTWKTDAPATGRALHAPANSAKFDAALPDFGYQATKWETKAGIYHMAFAFGLFPVQTYDWRLDMATADSRRVTTQSLGTFTAPACVLGASDEKDIIEDVMGVSTGVLGEMSDEEIARFMADLRAKNQNSDNDQSGNKIAAATFAPAALAAPVSEAQNSSQNSTTVNCGAIAAFALLAMGLVGWFLAKRFNR